MNNKESINPRWVKTGWAIGGLVGLGVLAYFVFRKAEDTEDGTLSNEYPEPSNEKPAVEHLNRLKNHEKVRKVEKIGSVNNYRKSESIRVNKRPRVKMPTDDSLFKDDLEGEGGFNDSLTKAREQRKPQAMSFSAKSNNPITEDEKINYSPLLEAVPEADEFPLRVGSQGERVERLQVWLMRNYGVFGKITNRYDEKIKALVSKHLGMTEVSEKTFNQYRMGKHVTEQVIIR